MAAHSPIDRLLIATGTRPRRLPALENSTIEIQYLRNVEDALRFRKSIHHKSRIVIVGGGVIGLEAACAAAKNGLPRHRRSKANSACWPAHSPPSSAISSPTKHRSHGVEFVFGATVSGSAPGGCPAQQRHRRSRPIWCWSALASSRSPRWRNVLACLSRRDRRRCLRPNRGIRHLLRRRRRAAIQPLSRPRHPGRDLGQCPEPGDRGRRQHDRRSQRSITTRRGSGPTSMTSTSRSRATCSTAITSSAAIERSENSPSLRMRGADIVGALSVNAAKDMAMLRRVIAADASALPAPIWNRPPTTCGPRLK